MEPGYNGGMNKQQIMMVDGKPILPEPEPMKKRRHRYAANLTRKVTVRVTPYEYSLLHRHASAKSAGIQDVVRWYIQGLADSLR